MFTEVLLRLKLLQKERKAYAMRLAILVVCLRLGSHLGLAVEKSPLTEMDVFNIEYATDPQISPDGTKVVYVRRFADIMTDYYYTNLWVVNFDGSDHRPLTTGNQHDTSPRWSPDGTRLLYLSDAQGSTQLFLRWMDMGQTAKLTNVEVAPQSPAWRRTEHWSPSSDSSHQNHSVSRRCRRTEECKMG